jgi:predicted aldo/keto reductase-like oxidoreductase
MNKDFHRLVKELKEEGRIRFIGLSNHGPEHRLAGEIKEPMEKVIIAAAEDGRFDLALFVYNFIQKEQGEKIIEACKKADMGITLMKVNPVNFYNNFKGSLDRAKEQNGQGIEGFAVMVNEYEAWVEQAANFRTRYGLESEESVRDASIKFVLGNPDIHTVCPSINSFNDLETFVKLSGTRLDNSEQGMLTEYSNTLGNYYCRHACGLCEPSCPHNVPVNTIMRYNHYFEGHGREKYAMIKYQDLLVKAGDKCKGCAGLCTDNCPHKLPVQSLLMHADRNLII